MAKMFRVYSVIQRPKQEDYWLNIGAAFPHEDGEGSTCCCRRCRCMATGSWSCARSMAPRRGRRRTNPRIWRTAKPEASERCEEREPRLA
jgi:hypothetical protein